MKNIAVLILIALLIVVVNVQAVDSENPTETPSTQSGVLNQINTIEKNARLIKENIASTVAELTKKNSNMLNGFIQETGDEIRILTSDDKKTIILTDETLTKYFQISASKKSESSQKSLKKGDYIVVGGSYLGSQFTANVVYKQSKYIVSAGDIITINNDENSVEVITTDKDTYILDIEKTTVQLMMDSKTLEIDKTGFSKLKIGDKLHFVAKDNSKSNNKDENRISVIKLLIIPQEFFSLPTE